MLVNLDHPADEAVVHMHYSQCPGCLSCQGLSGSQGSASHSEPWAVLCSTCGLPSPEPRGRCFSWLGTEMGTSPRPGSASEGFSPFKVGFRVLERL